MRRALAAAALLALALVGCTDDGQSPTSTTSSPPPTGQTSTTPTSTTSDPADEPPALPYAAKSQTTAGAKAFVRHYADVLNYAWAEGLAQPIRNLSARSCATCKDLSRFIKTVYAAGGFQRGGEWTIDSVGAVPGQPSNRPVMLPLVHVGSGEWKRSEDGRLMKIRAHKVNLQIELLWTNGTWKIAEVSS